jgi:hypothetical protein
VRAFILATLLFAFAAHAAEPNYSAWNAILQKYYDPARGMDYAALKARDARSLEAVRVQLGGVNVNSLTPKQQLAYWINVYNVNVVATVVEKYPVKSIRDISTDPIVRVNVFKKPRVPFGGSLLSLNDVENKKIRDRFHDPRIHFAINCAARSCPPIRHEAYTGDRIDAQLDDQARKFLNANTRFSRKGDTVIVHVTKVMDWFARDFGDRIAFLRRYVSIPAGGKVELDFDGYDWSLNDR